MTLSKSQYTRALQCQKSLWLYKHRPDLRDLPDDTQEALFDAGHEVGDLAKRLFPDGVEVAFDRDDFEGMITQTRSLMESGVEVIYEVTFQERGIFVMVDILVRRGEVWDLYEVKGSTRTKAQYLDDVAIQWYSLSETLSLGRAHVVHLNNQYSRRGALDIEALFTIDDVTEIILTKQAAIPETLSQIASMLEGDTPAIDIGKHCHDPYACDFQTHCWAHIPTEDSVFELSYAMGKQWDLYERGILHIDDIPDDYPLGANASLQIAHHRSQEIILDRERIGAFLEGISYPVNFFDFETFQEPIPRFDGQRPYMQIPFQYSLHILHEDGRLEHRAFLGDADSDPRDSLIEQMLSDITATGSIVAYSGSFEITQIKNLALYRPEHSDALLALTERFIDLADPFGKKHYYHPRFKGKYSIKIVLPTLFPDDKELDYSQLGSIQNGGDAMQTFAHLHRIEDPDRRETIREDLLAYCHLDTLAMVRIWERLGEMCQKAQSHE